MYWLTGAEASCPINQDLTNTRYNGEFNLACKLKQHELIQGKRDGLLTFHVVTDPVGGNVNGDVCILEDINSFTTFLKTKNKDFSLNQNIRILDNLAIDFARLFNKTYLGKVGNSDDGRDMLWADGCKVMEQYQKVGAIQNYKDEDLAKPVQGDEKSAVLWEFGVDTVVSMKRLYQTVVVA